MGESTVIGNGTIDYQNIFEYKELAGLDYFYVEQESYSKSPIESVEESFQFIRDHLI